MFVTLSLLVLVALAVPLVSAQVWIIVGMFRVGASGREHRVGGGAGAGDVDRAAWPTVSVIIPAHNEGSRLPGTLASLAKVSYPGEWEIVLVDDRSSDSTPSLLARAAHDDPRITVVTIDEPSRRLAPKVNAVRAGILASTGEVIVTSDADCRYHGQWLEALVGTFGPGVAMVSGYVETDVAGTARPDGRVPVWARIEAADWFSLMLVSRSMLGRGRAYASSANNQAYLRSAFEQAGGFGAGARAPSGDEDLLAQRLGGLPRQRVVFADLEAARVMTRSAGSVRAFLRQRSRWVSRYRHVVHYQPSFIAGLTVLGLESIALSALLLAAPFVPELRLPTLAVYMVQTAAHVVGMNIGARQLSRRDLGGAVSVVWALSHPFIIAIAVIWSWLAPGDWRAGAVDYRRSLMRRRWRLLLRSLVPRHNVDT